MTAILTPTKHFSIRICLNLPSVTFHPFPGDPYFTFTWKKRPSSVRCLFQTDPITTPSQKLERLDRKGCCWLVLSLENYPSNPCLYQDLIEVSPLESNSQLVSLKVRYQAIECFWEDFFSRIWIVPHEDLLQKTIQWQRVRYGKYGLPLGLYVMVDEIKTSLSPLGALKL